MPWTSEQEQELTSLVRAGDNLYVDIAKKLGKKPAAVSWKAKRLGLKNSAASKIVGKCNSKHAHLREKVMRYFLKHSKEECMEKFGLNKSEIKSLFTIAYRIPELRHLRKDTRTKREWTTKDFKFLLQHAGLMPRDWIADQLGRGGELGIKDRLEKLGISSKSLNGITLTQFREAFGKEPDFYLQTKAGPGRGGTPTYYKIIPWVWIETEIKEKRLKCPGPFRKVVRSMAIFQEWIFEGDALRKLKRICK